jgi:hypothetical protein
MTIKVELMKIRSSTPLRLSENQRKGLSHMKKLKINTRLGIIKKRTKEISKMEKRTLKIINRAKI